MTGNSSRKTRPVGGELHLSSESACPTFPERLFVSLSFEKAVDGIINSFLLTFPTGAEISKKFPVVEKVMAGDFRYAEHEMPVRNLLEDIYTDPDKSLKIVRYAALMIGPLWIPGAIGSGSKGHDLSSLRISYRHNVEGTFYLSRGILRYSGYVFVLADRPAAAASVSQAQPRGG